MDLPLVDGMEEPSPEQYGQWPGQAKVVFIGFPPRGWFANEPYKRSFFSPTFGGGEMDSPGKGLGQADTGDAVFPSNTWFPKGETDKSVSEDIQLGYPGTADAAPLNNVRQQIEKTFGKEYREAFDLLAVAVQKNEPVNTSIELITSHSDYVLDPNILKQLANQYLKK